MSIISRYRSVSKLIIKREYTEKWELSFHKGYYCTEASIKPTENRLQKHFQSKIKATGPITVAEYMREVLINPHSGYYMHTDVFGTLGDFITSPEITQIFGELIGVWFFNEWSRLGQPDPVQLVEFGPGRGTLADDILRTISKLNKRGKSFSLHLIEVSPYLRNVQKQKLCATETSLQELTPDGKSYKTKYGIPVSWHQSIETVPRQFSLFLAHEFFDAMPIHKFQKTADGWREILIDCKDIGGELQFVLSKNATPSSKLLVDPDEKRQQVEISPESGILIQKLSRRIKEFGGISLIVDYGYLNEEKTDTFRGFRKHKLHDPLLDPGLVDLTADVDFSYLTSHLVDQAIAVGPVTQSYFLKNMSIDVRLEKLLQKASHEQKEVMQSGYNMIMDPLQMGERYKFLALYPAVLKEFLSTYPPPGFL